MTRPTERRKTLGPETLPCTPRGAIPRAQIAVMLLRDGISGRLDLDEALRGAEKQLWRAWGAVYGALAERAGEIPDRGRGRAA